MKDIKLLREFISRILREAVLDEREMNEILKGYLEAALWTEEEQLMDDGSDNDEEEYDDEEESDLDRLVRSNNVMNQKLISSFTIEDLDADSKIQAYVDIKNFMEMAGEAAVSEAMEDQGAFRLGMDIWLSRNGHGSGFFDHSYENEKVLMDAARGLGGVDMYISDDGHIVFSNAHK